MIKKTCNELLVTQNENHGFLSPGYDPLLNVESVCFYIKSMWFVERQGCDVLILLQCNKLLVCWNDRLVLTYLDVVHNKTKFSLKSLN